MISQVSNQTSLLNNLSYIILWSCQKVCDVLDYHLNNILIRFGLKLHGQIIGIPMGTYGAPLVTDLLLFIMRERLRGVSF